MSEVATYDVHAQLAELDERLQTMQAEASASGEPVWKIEGWGTLVARRELLLVSL